MNGAQIGLYRREWGRVRKVLRQTLPPDQADAQRHALHIKALGQDKSSTDLNNEEFDAILKEFRAISQPSNARTQIALAEMPETRSRTYIRHLLAALDRGDDYAESIISRMQKGRKWASTGAASMLTLDTLGRAALKDLMIALKMECRRRWKTKDHLLGEIALIRQDNDFPELPTAAAVMDALCITTLAPLDRLVFEDLLIVLSTLRRLANGTLPLPTVFSSVTQAA